MEHKAYGEPHKEGYQIFLVDSSDRMSEWKGTFVVDICISLKELYTDTGVELTSWGQDFCKQERSMNYI